MEKHNQVFDRLNPLVNQEGWQDVEEYLADRIDSCTKTLMNAPTWEEVLEIRGKIRALEEVKNLKNIVRQYKQSTKN